MLDATPLSVITAAFNEGFSDYFLPVQLDSSPNLGTVALPKPTRGSGDFISLLGTDGFVELPPGPADIAAGYVAPLYRW